MVLQPPLFQPAKNVSLIRLSLPTLKALADGDLDAANRAGPLTFPPYFAGPDWRSVWRRRVAQVTDDPAAAAWITRAVVDTDSGAVVGRAGFHGPPDAAGMVEVGYAIDPDFRRRSYARAALVFLLNWAKSDPGIRTVRASIAPDNVASRALVAQYGFVEIGEQWDDEDGLETIFEVDA